MYLEIILESALFSIAFFAVAWFVKKSMIKMKIPKKFFHSLNFVKKDFHVLRF